MQCNPPILPSLFISVMTCFQFWFSLSAHIWTSAVVAHPWIIKTPLSLEANSPSCHGIASGSPGARVVPGSGSLSWHVRLSIALLGTRRGCAPLPHGFRGRGAPQRILPVVVPLVRLTLFWAVLHPIAPRVLSLQASRPRILSLQASSPRILPLNASLGILSLNPTVPRLLPLQPHL